MFYRRKLSERINHIHERALRIVYKNFKSSFQELLFEDNSLNIHHRNVQKLVTEIVKVKNGLSPELMNDVLEHGVTIPNSMFRVYRKTILPTGNFVFQVKEDPYIKVWHRISLPWPHSMKPSSK